MVNGGGGAGFVVPGVVAFHGGTAEALNFTPCTNGNQANVGSTRVNGKVPAVFSRGSPGMTVPGLTTMAGVLPPGSIGRCWGVITPPDT
jgi:hypothetical protein